MRRVLRVRVLKVFERTFVQSGKKGLDDRAEIEYGKDGWWVLLDLGAPIAIYISQEKPEDLTEGSTITLALES